MQKVERDRNRRRPHLRAAEVAEPFLQRRRVAAAARKPKVNKADRLFVRSTTRAGYARDGNRDVRRRSLQESGRHCRRDLRADGAETAEQSVVDPKTVYLGGV